MAGSEKTHIQITKKQHEKLQMIKEHLDEEAGKNLGLTQQSWTPSFADAVEHLMQNYEWSDSLENNWKERDFDSGSSDADCDFAPTSESNGR